MKKEENLKKTKISKIDKKNVKSQDISIKIPSDERLGHHPENDSIKISKNNIKKLKMKFASKKRKSIGMFLVLFIFMSISTICLSICYFFFKSETNELFNNNKKLSLGFFVLMLISSFIFSIFVSCCECLIKTHFLGIIFILILNIAIDYCVLYISYLSYFEQVFSFLIVLVCGSLGCLLITIFVKDDIPSLFILLLFNLFFSIIGIIILFFIYNKTWNILFGIFSLIISEFNIYSSKYKLCSKEKKDPLIYSQPFELIITFCKMLFFFFNIIKKIIKFFSKICKCKKKKENDEEENHDNQNIPTDDIEGGVENIEQNEVNNAKIGKNQAKNIKKK